LPDAGRGSRAGAAYALEFARADGTGGFVRLELRPDEGVAWYWAYLVGPRTGLVVVRDHDVPLPRVGLEIRADGLWAELICETPAEHWSFGLEAFGLRLDDPTDALAPGGEIGERIPVGLDLEWETDLTDRTAGTVRGELLVGPGRIEFEGPGRFTVADHPTDWWGPGVPGPVRPRAEDASAIVPLGRGAALTRTLSTDPLGWSDRIDLG
jgi:hypothetical protein